MKVFTYELAIWEVVGDLKALSHVFSLPGKEEDNYFFSGFCQFRHLRA